MIRVGLGLILALAACRAASAGEVTPAGEHLARTLDGMDVEHRWLPGRAVAWRTGEPDPRGRQAATHCSAFVAAACERLGVDILRPPDHPQALLANAQDDWLRTAGPRAGWGRVGSPAEAQRLANLGGLVVACYRNPDPRRPGHIAIVRPSAKGAGRVAEEGPQVIQAGQHNAGSIDLRRGFAHHRGAWEWGELDYFAHAVPPRRPAS